MEMIQMPLLHSLFDNGLVVFSSRGNSAKVVAEKVSECLECPSVWLREGAGVYEPHPHTGYFIFVCPTYGDGELDLATESFLLSVDWRLFTGRNYSICELGLYRGYQEVALGAGEILDVYLKQQGMVRRGRILSVDSVGWREEWLGVVESWAGTLQ